MKRKTVAIAIIAIIVTILRIGTEKVFAEPSNISILRKWGSILKEQSNSLKPVSEEELYAIGESAVITRQEYEQTVAFYSLQEDKNTAEEKADRYVKEREALYAAAVEAGYTATEEEIHDYLDNLKKTIETVDNKDEVMAVMESFPSEEEYWEYEFTVYSKNLPIEKYVQDLKEDYLKENGLDKETSESEISWQEHFKNVKRELVEKQNYKME